MKWSPAVGLIGMRQTGKTTLVRELAEIYFTFDDANNLARFETGGLAVLQAGPYPMILDEVQKAPLLFDQIKIEIDRRRTPGRFGLTGSVRFSARKAIRESLTGRVVTFELLPLTLSESYEQSMTSFLHTVWKEDSPQKLTKLLKSKDFSTRGGAHVPFVI